MVISYEGKIVLAPMVRVGSLPLRLLALQYGADLVWSPEIVDKKLIGCQRIRNEFLRTWDYVENDTLVLRTNDVEKGKLIVQLGSSDPELALAAAKIVEKDAAGIDLNCGCPKRFSVHAGMGAALLQNPNRLVSILRCLVEGLPDTPITAKIRLLPDSKATLDLVSKIATTGIRALTVHCRTPTERPRQPAHHDLLSEIAKLCPFPVIANGDVFSHADVQRLRSLGITSFMLARAAQWNVSVFRSEGLLPPMLVSQVYLQKAIETENPFSNTKFTLLQMWIDRSYSNVRFTQALQKCKTYVDLCKLFRIEQAEYDEYSLPALEQIKG